MDTRPSSVHLVLLTPLSLLPCFLVIFSFRYFGLGWFGLVWFGFMRWHIALLPGVGLDSWAQVILLPQL